MVNKVIYLIMKIIQEILNTKLNALVNYTLAVNLLILAFSFFTYPFYGSDHDLHWLIRDMIYTPLLLIFYLSTFWSWIWKVFFNPDKPMSEQPLFALSFMLLFEAGIVLLVMLFV